jgi:hypothetical protein
MKAPLLIPLSFLIGVFSSFTEKTSENPNETYMLWSGEKPSNEIEVIRGKYWLSAHFTKEYIMYLELLASPVWRRNL